MSTLIVFDIGCSGCSRRYSMNVQTMLTRKTCTFCGAPLVLSPEAKAACDAKRATTVVKSAKVSGECPICTRVVWIEPVSPKTTCQFCSCPCTLNAEGKLVALPNADTIPMLSRTYVSGINCPSCYIKKLVESDGLGQRARCTACKAEVDLRTIPLDRMLDLSRTESSGLSDFVGLVLAQRWSYGDLGLPEAEELLALSKDADALSSSPNDPLSPFDVDITLEIVQYAILCLSAASIQRGANNAKRLVMEIGAAGVKSKGPSNSLLLTNAIGIGLFAATGTGFYSLGGKKDEKEATVEPAMLLEFAPVANGTDFSGLYLRGPSGQIGAGGRKESMKIMQALRSKFKDGMRRYYALKALFGIWMPGTVIPAITVQALEKRLKALGGPLGANADAWSAAWVPEAMTLE